MKISIKVQLSAIMTLILFLQLIVPANGSELIVSNNRNSFDSEVDKDNLLSLQMDNCTDTEDDINDINQSRFKQLNEDEVILSEEVDSINDNCYDSKLDEENYGDAETSKEVFYEDSIKNYETNSNRNSNYVDPFGREYDSDWLYKHYNYSSNGNNELIISSAKYLSDMNGYAYIPAYIDGYQIVLGGNKSIWYEQNKYVSSIKIEEGVKLAPDSSSLFSGLDRVSSIDLRGVDTSAVVDMSWMFYKMSALKSVNLAGINTSNVTNMSFMFRECSKLESVDLTGIDTSSVTNMSEMFYCASGVKVLDLSSFNTSNVQDMSSMFNLCMSLREIDISNFDTSKVEKGKMNLFSYCWYLRTLDLRSLSLSSIPIQYDQSNIENLYLPSEIGRDIDFSNYRKLANIYYTGTREQWESLDNTVPCDVNILYEYTGDIREICITEDKGDAKKDDWYKNYYNYYLSKKYKKLVLLSSKGQMNSERITEAVIPAQTIIDGEVYTTMLDNSWISFWNNGNDSWKGYSLWYNDRASIESIVIEDGVEVVPDCSYLFAEMNNLEKIDISGLNTSNVTDMSFMFSGDKKLTDISLVGVKTSKVKNMRCMFTACSGLKNIDFIGIDTGLVTDMSGMFNLCSSISILDLSTFNTQNVRNMSSMFSRCSLLNEINISSFDTTMVTNMSYMFNSCKYLKKIDVSNFDTSNVTRFDSMFEDLGNFIVNNVIDLRSFSIASTASQKSVFPSNIVDLYFSTQTVNNYDFTTLNKLDRIYYEGTKEQWDALNNKVSDSTTILYSYEGGVKEVIFASRIILDNYSCNLSIGDKVSINAVVLPIDARDKSIVWKSNNESVAVVDSAGIVTAINKGNTTISATTKKGTNVSCWITVDDSSAQIPTISIAKVNGIEGDEVLVPISVTGNPGISSLIMSITYDPTLYLSSIQNGPLMSDNNAYLVGDGYNIEWPYRKAEPLNEDGVLFILHFKFRSGAEKGQYYPVSIRTYKDNPVLKCDNDIPIIKVEPGYVYLSKSIKGDVTGDNEVGMGDIVKVARVVAGSATLTDDEKAAADVTGDGDAGMNDVVKLARFVAGSISEL